MISKGTTHNNGARLAAYMETGKEGERAALWELRGFAATNIRDAFRCVDAMAGATKAEQPFFHVQVRNREGETLTHQQFEYAADRIERMLGLSSQPRAITFHTYEHNNDQHMHVAWSRIDQDTLTAKPLPFFKDRLKKISRELELHFGLEPVTNHREGNIRFAPTRAEDEQARRLGLDIHAVRNTIRECWDRSDCGTSFQAALEHEGFILAQGERRAFVVIDREGGMHALGKRILDVTATKIRERLSDITRDELPSVGIAQAFVKERAQERTPKKTQHQEKQAPVWDRDRDDRVWQDSVINAAIDKEKVERNFVEPQEQKTETKQRGAGAGGREKENLEEQEQKREKAQRATNENRWPVNPPAHQGWPGFKRAATEATLDGRMEGLRGPAAQLWAAWRQDDNEKARAAWNDGKTVSVPTPSREAFAAALDDRGLSFASVTRDEAYRSHRESAFARAVGRYAPRFNEGEIVLVTEARPEYRRDGEIIEPRRLHKLDKSLAEKFVTHLGTRSQLKGIDASLQSSNLRAQQRSADREAARLDYATNIKDFSRKVAKGNIRRTVRLGEKAFSGIGKTLEAVGNAFESLFAPTLTPAQIREGEKQRYRREAEAENTIDFEKYTAEVAYQRQQQENEREAARQRQRDGGGRER